MLIIRTLSCLMAAATCRGQLPGAILIGLISACTTTTPADDGQWLFSRASASVGLSEQVIITPDFELASLRRIKQPGAPIRIYLEGDGKAWLSRYRVSADPTPGHAVGLQLALADNSANVIYIARPCQFVQLSRQKQCTAEVWTRNRYSAAIVAMYVSVFRTISRQYHNASLELIGFSGGATIVMLAAPALPELSNIRTVAGNLDIAEFSRIHNLPLTTATTAPAINVTQLERIPQLHFVGSRDDVVPGAVARAYQDQLDSLQCSQIVELDSAHTDEWPKLWPELLQMSPACISSGLRDEPPSG